MPAETVSSMQVLLRAYWKQILGVLLIALLLIAAAFDWIPLMEMVDELGITYRNPRAPYLFLATMILASVLAVPTLFLVILAGPVFGLGQGVLLATIGLNIGCGLTFWISRLTGQKMTQRLIRLDDRAAKISRQIDDRGFWIIFYLRLSLVFPYNVLNYLAGSTRIRYRDYAAGSFLGMLPGTILYVLLSAKAATVREHPLEFLSAGILLIAFILFIHYLNCRRNKMK